MRQIVLDTETTGLDPRVHRIIEIGAVELIDRRATGRTLHRYVDPERDVDEAAFEVHGLSREFLSSYPRFADVAGEFVEFIRDAQLVIHNAEFDVEFIDSEFSRLVQSPPPVKELAASVVDSLWLARQKHPGQKNSLDALCRRYAVDDAQRELHGALLDAQLLTQVYLAMTGGQTSLLLAGESELRTDSGRLEFMRLPEGRLPLIVVAATADEEALHEALLDRLQRAGAHVLWRALPGHA